MPEETTEGRILNHTLRQLLPAGVAVVASTECPVSAELWEAETPAAVGMVAKRQREFIHGRYCARLALRELGCEPTAIPKGPDRAPEWPAGIAGSITHTGNIAAAAVARSDEFAGVGIDIEVAGELEPETLAMILRPDEQPALGAADGRLIFSIKETLYKGLYPQARRYIDFKEMHVMLDRSRQVFIATPHLQAAIPGLPERLEGRYAVTRHYVVSAFWLRTSVAVP